MATNGRHSNGSGRPRGRYGGLRLVAAGRARHPSAPGGRSPASPDAEDLVDRFMASDEAIGMSVPPTQARALATSLVRARRETGSGDPLDWDREAMRSLLDGWRVGGLVASLRDALHTVDVVVRFIRFADRHRHVPRYVTNETLDALAAMLPPAVWDAEAELWGTTGPRVPCVPYYVAHRRRLHEEIGGVAAVAALDDRPLADEPFDWEGLGHADRHLVADVLRRADEACAVFCDVEVRTLCRRGLAALVRYDHALFQRSQRTDVIAAGLVWATLLVNELRTWVDSPFDRPQQQAIAASIGVTSGTMSGRAGSIRCSWARAGAMQGAANRHSARRRAYLAELAELAQYDDRYGPTSSDRRSDTDTPWS